MQDCSIPVHPAFVGRIVAESDEFCAVALADIPFLDGDFEQCVERAKADGAHSGFRHFILARLHPVGEYADHAQHLCARFAERVNRLVHPAVREDFNRWVAGQSAPLVAMECAILYESGFDRLVDKVLLVHAPEEICLRRAMLRDGASEAQVKARMRAQMPDAARLCRADYILENDGQEELPSRLGRIISQIMKDAQRQD